MEIVQNIENKLLGRKEILAVMENTKATPKRADIQKEIAKKLKVKEELVIVNNITHKYGSSNLKIKAKVYDNEKVLKMNARPHMLKRNTVEAAPVEEAVDSSTPKADETAKEE